MTSPRVTSAAGTTVEHILISASAPIAIDGIARCAGLNRYIRTRRRASSGSQSRERQAAGLSLAVAGSIRE